MKCPVDNSVNYNYNYNYIHLNVTPPMPHPPMSHTPLHPEDREPGNTVNAQAVRILLECILV